MIYAQPAALERRRLDKIAVAQIAASVLGASPHRITPRRNRASG
jgi:hypothetical protein